MNDDMKNVTTETFLYDNQSSMEEVRRNLVETAKILITSNKKARCKNIIIYSILCLSRWVKYETLKGL